MEIESCWWPVELFKDKNLNKTESLFLVLILNIESRSPEWETYTNSWFSKFFDVTPRTCSQVINSLKRKKYIKTYYMEGRNNCRIIEVLDKSKYTEPSGILPDQY